LQSESYHAAFRQEKQRLKLFISTQTGLAGIYIHIPFCRQKCHYCNFHFTTSLRRKNELTAALLKEMDLQKNYLGNEPVETIYFGGGTPSLLDPGEIKQIINKMRENFSVVRNAEITVEANPDDITDELLTAWKETGINRLSIGVQSFFDEDLKWMNRLHTGKMAVNSLRVALQYFNNISVDLIYGFPLLTNKKWKQNVDRAISSGVPHLSCYALTVEQKTPLFKMIREKKTEDINPDKQSEQFLLLMQWMEDAGYEHYEISNFAKPGFRSRHNSSYWSRKKYLGIGPSAHSFDGESRQWNVANNNIYIESINRGVVKFEKEILTPVQQLNEYIMTSLRTSEGLNLNRLQSDEQLKLSEAAKKYLDGGLMKNENNCLVLTREGRLLADGIAAALFF
jgi:oxygen-independent coproporphyrinogen-3 oxidase